MTVSTQKLSRFHIINWSVHFHFSQGPVINWNTLEENFQDRTCTVNEIQCDNPCIGIQLFTVYPGILYMYFQNIDLYISQNLLKTRAQKYCTRFVMYCNKDYLCQKSLQRRTFVRTICLLSIKEILIIIFSSNCSYNAEHVQRFFKSWFYTERKCRLILHVFLNGECRAA